MKNCFKYLAAIAVALAASSCAKEIEYTPRIPEADGYKYVFRIADTKTELDGATVKWESGDKVGIFAEGSVNKYGTISTVSPVEFPVYLGAALSAGDMVYAYYPYSNSNSSATASAVSLIIPESQSEDFDAMPQVAIPYVTSSEMAKGSNTVDDLHFCNLGSVIRYLVYSSSGAYSGETVQSISFAANQALAGSFTFNLTAVDYSNQSTLAISGYSAKTVSVTAAPSIGSNANNAGTVDMVVAPGTYYGTMVLVTDAARYTYTLSEPQKLTFARNGIKRIGLDLESPNCVRLEPHPTGEVFVPATSIVAGDKILLASGKTGSVGVIGAQNSNNRSAVSYALQNGAIISSDETYPLTVGTGETNASYFTLFDPDTNGYLYAASSGSNYLKTQASIDVNAEWQIVLDASSMATTFAATGSEFSRKILRYNNSSKIFSCYASGQDDIYVFKKIDGTFISAADQDIAYSVTKVEIPFAVYNGSGATTAAFNTNPGDCASNLVVDSANGKVKFDITANSGATRAVIVDISNNGETRTVTINQAQAPTKLVMSEITATPDQNQIVFSWSAVENATGYQVSTDGGSSYSDTQTARTYTWQGLTPLTTYTIKVKAMADEIYYATSDPVSKSATTLAPKLALPTGGTWTQATKTLTWTDTNTGAGTYGTDYKYVYSIDNGVNVLEVSSSTSAVLNITESKTAKIKAVALTADNRDSDWTDGTYCVIGDVITYNKVGSISDGTYLICYTTGNKVATGYASNYISTADQTISGTSINQTETLDNYSFVITALTGDDAGYYSIKQGSNYIGYNTSTKFKTATSVSSDSFKWQITFEGDVVNIICKAATARYWGYYADGAQFRCYSNGSGYSNPRPTLYKRSQ